MLSHYDYSTCFVFTSLDNGWGILSDHGSIYEHNWTFYNGCTQCTVIHLLIIITELNQVINHLLLRAILIVTVAIVSNNLRTVTINYLVLSIDTRRLKLQ